MKQALCNWASSRPLKAHASACKPELAGTGARAEIIAYSSSKMSLIVVKAVGSFQAAAVLAIGTAGTDVRCRQKRDQVSGKGCNSAQAFRQ